MRFNYGRVNVFVALLCGALLAVVAQPVKGVVVERKVSGAGTLSNDDAEQHLGNNGAGVAGGMEGPPNDSSDLELGTNGPPPDDLGVGTDGEGTQLVGVRWLDLTIPKNVTITNAYVQFRVNEPDKDIVYNEIDGTIVSQPVHSIRVTGELNPNAATYGDTAFDITNRPDTTTAVDWLDVPRWAYVPESGTGCVGCGTSGPNQRTPDLSSIIQEIIDQPGWSVGNPLALMFFPLTENTNRTADSWETSDTNGNVPGNRSALLHVEYVPEPASLATMAIGLLGLLAASRRRV
jgi:hypothetical protein